MCMTPASDVTLSNPNLKDVLVIHMWFMAFSLHEEVKLSDDLTQSCILVTLCVSNVRRLEVNSARHDAEELF